MPTYPLTLPSTIQPKSSEFKLQRATAVTESPFTGKTRAYQYEKAVWSASITYPPMSNKQVGEFRGFLLNLKGRLGTFKMGDPDRLVPTGRIVTSGFVNSGYQKMNISTASVGDETITGNYSAFIGGGSGWPNASTFTNIFYAGDMISINDALYMVTEDTTFINYQANISIQPPLKQAITSVTTINLETPQYGVWRMDSDILGWSSDHMKNHGISFSCTEAI